MTEQEIKLMEEGMWVNGITNQSTKTALFHALYQGPIEEKKE